MKVITKPNEFFGQRKTITGHFLSSMFGSLLFLRYGIAGTIAIVPRDRNFFIFLSTNVCISFLIFTVFAFLFTLLGKWFGGRTSFHEVHSNLGFVGIPRVIFSVFFYASLLLLNQKIFNEEMIWLSIFLLVVAITTKIWELILVFAAFNKLTGLNYKKTAILLAVYIILTVIISNLASVKGMSHPYIDIMIQKINSGL